MRYLIISDLHANWEALSAVIEAARGSYDEVLCLGDLVGYCADPNRVVNWVRANSACVVRGNHDKACAGLDDLEWFNPIAQQAARWTMEALNAENLEYLRALPAGPMLVAGAFQIFHGGPLDEDEYIVSAYDASHQMEYVQTPVSWFGHTHLQGGFRLLRGAGVRKVERITKNADSLVLEIERDGLYMLNPGSVGQPRDGDARAAWAIYDTEERIAVFRRVCYDVRSCQDKILKAGLPELLAFRLEVGS